MFLVITYEILYDTTYEENLSYNYVLYLDFREIAFLFLPQILMII